MGAVVSVFEPGMVNVKLQGQGTRTFHFDELEHATWPRGKTTSTSGKEPLDPDKLAEQKRSVIEELRRLKESSEPKPVRASVLDEAKALTTGARNNVYGPPTQDFDRTAGILNAMGYKAHGPKGPGTRDIEPHDIALMVAAVKMSRLVWSPEKRDNWVDLAGYAACGYECATVEGYVEPTRP